MGRRTPVGQSLTGMSGILRAVGGFRMARMPQVASALTKKTERIGEVMLKNTAINNLALVDLIAAIESPDSGTHHHAAQALGFVRDGIITGEGPTTRGRVHFSRELDATDTAWCKRILTA